MVAPNNEFGIRPCVVLLNNEKSVSTSLGSISDVDNQPIKMSMKNQRKIFEFLIVKLNPIIIRNENASGICFTAAPFGYPAKASLITNMDRATATGGGSESIANESTSSQSSTISSIDDDVGSQIPFGRNLQIALPPLPIHVLDQRPASASFMRGRTFDVSKLDQDRSR
ncbi:hypothetical protein TcWFU_004584 [Taenia crassiceps]|uniref:Uncharacterized protein n=1 Tax=Taenia crassiceps TaxID=6207 RepID=A0ABR4QGV5_9CEST